MANPEHVELLKHGVHNWNAWRKNNRSVEPDLKGVSGYDLTPEWRLWPDLGGVDLIEANLRNADLRRAHLRSADLCGANLEDGRFDEADLSGSNLRGPT